MIQDKQLEFSAAQAIGAGGASTNQVDTGVGARGGQGMGDVELVFTVDQTFTAAGAATLTIQVRSSTAANMAGAVVHEVSQPIVLADLQIGDEIPFYPRFPRNANRYLDVNYVVTTGPFTAGSLTARGTAARQHGRL